MTRIRLVPAAAASTSHSRAPSPRSRNSDSAAFFARGRRSNGPSGWGGKWASSILGVPGVARWWRATATGPSSPTWTRITCSSAPTGKTFDAWQPDVSSIPAPTQQALRTLEWVHRRENLVVCGPSGTGKTFLLEALGPQAVEEGLKVAWFTLEDLGVLLRRHRADDTVSKAIARVLRADLVVVDDIGLLPVAADAAEGLYRLVDAAYEKRSVAISSNLHPSGFDELMPKTLATATVDRLLHHAHVCQTSGDSVRLTQALAGQGVSPLS